MSNDPIVEKPLFIPLKKEYYEAFERGEKTTEFRAYGPRWNERTCRIGRKAIISCGYGKSHRMVGEVYCALLAPHTPDFVKIYGDKEKCFAISLTDLRKI